MNLILFDVDGTLVDSQHMIVAAQSRAIGRLNLPMPSREAMLSIVGLSLYEAFSHLFGADAPLEALAEGYKAAWRELVQEGETSPLYPGAQDLLTGLAARKDVYLGIATGKSRRGIHDFLERYGWQNLFATIQTADDAPSKPAPDMIVQAMAEMDCAPQDCTMIGDTSFDMDMAKYAGVQGIGVTWGFHPPQRLTSATVLVDDFAALQRVLAANFKVLTHA